MNKLLLAAFVFLGFFSLRAEEPTLTVYDTIKADLVEASTYPELILKVTNPTERTLYIYGLSTTDVPYTIEILRDGKWVEVPPRRCGTLMSFRRFHPGSHLIFSVLDAPLDALSDENVTFRVRAYLYTSSDRDNFYKNPAVKPYIEALSPVLHSKDFQSPKDPKSSGLPRVPGHPSDPLASPSTASPAIPNLPPLPK